MKDLTDLNTREEFLDEAETTERRIGELREHRDSMLERVNSSKGLTHLLHNLNYIFSEKQIVRHIRFFKIYRERLEVHYERLFGEEMPDPKDLSGQASENTTGR